MVDLPVQFNSHASASGEFSQPWRLSSGSSEAMCAIPFEFGGHGGGSSPEDLFLQALMNCFMGTFKVYANASRLLFSSLSVKGTLIVDKNSERQIRMKKCIFELDILGAEKPDRIRTLVDKALRDGFILNSVTTEVESILRINEVLYEKSGG